MLRWIELSAFTPIFRSHQGSNPKRNHQITDHPDTLAHFARFSRVYAAFAEYRGHLCKEAEALGLPLIRHPWLHYPSDAQACSLELQFLLGSEFMVAPVLDKGRTSVRLYLPKGEWVHLWSGQHVSIAVGCWCNCASPLGAPPVFYLSSSSFAKDVATQIAFNGDTGGACQEQVCVPEGLCMKESKSTLGVAATWRKLRRTNSQPAPNGPKEAWGTASP